MARLQSRTSRPRHQPPQPTTPYSVDAVTGLYVPYYWEFVRKFVDDALEHAHGELASEDIFNYLLSDRMRMYVVRRPLICGAATCEVVQYVRKKAIRVVTVGGTDFDAWMGLLNVALLKWAGEIKADGVEAYVRRGMVKKLESIGYRQTYVGVWIDGQVKRDTDKHNS